MKTKAPNPAAGLPGNLDPLLRAYFEAAQLKQLYRQGWLRAGVPPERCESVAEHTFGVALLGLLAARSYSPALDIAKVLRLALLHDLGEAHAGDLYAPADGVEAAEKHRREEQAVSAILGGLPDGDAWLADWQEYERGESLEAQLVRQLDRLEMALQAVIYERQEGLNLDEFFASAAVVIHDPPLRALMDPLTGLRPGEG